MPEIDLFRVIALVGYQDPLRGCQIIEPNAIYPAIYTSVFGPAPRKACEDFVTKNCAGWPWVPRKGSKEPQDHLLGRAVYGARRVGPLITLMAAGILRNMNDRALLLPLPILIWPPQFQLLVESGGVSLPALKSFEVTATLPDPQKQIQQITVHDEDGKHAVPVLG